MEHHAFLEFVTAASRRAVATPGLIGHLVLSQTVPNLEPKIREPEMRHALAQEAEGSAGYPVYYGIEVPTKHGYRFTTAPGEQKMAARHDFVILGETSHDATRLNLLELKEGQPGRVTGKDGNAIDGDYPAISKDFQKLLFEQAEHGKAILHICHAADANTIPAVLEKHNAALKQAIGKPRPQDMPDPLQDSCWFTLFILVVHQRGWGNNHPFLYYTNIVPAFGVWLAAIRDGEMPFRPDQLQKVPLAQ